MRKQGNMQKEIDATEIQMNTPVKTCKINARGKQRKDKCKRNANGNKCKHDAKYNVKASQCKRTATANT